MHVQVMENRLHQARLACDSWHRLDPHHAATFFIEYSFRSPVGRVARDV